MISIIPDVIFKTREKDEAIGGENPYKWKDVNSEERWAC